MRLPRVVLQRRWISMKSRSRTSTRFVFWWLPNAMASSCSTVRRSFANGSRESPEVKRANNLRKEDLCRPTRVSSSATPISRRAPAQDADIDMSTVSKEILQERQPFDVAWRTIDGLKIRYATDGKGDEKVVLFSPAGEHLCVRSRMEWADEAI